MDKEKQIEGMIEAMSESCGSCFGSGEAECIYNAGYRKASDVAREIFEEIEALIYSKCFSVRADRDVTGLIIDGERFAELKKKYTESENNNE